MQIELHMVGHHRNNNITIKNVRFVNGVAHVRGADELVGNICKYLESYGAFQLHIAEVKQAVLDKEAGEAGDMRAVRARLEKAEREADDARAMLAEAQAVVDEMSKTAKRTESKNGTLENKQAAEGRGSQSNKGSANKSSK